MTFIEIGIGEGKEKEVLPEGEYDLVIMGAEQKNKNDKDYIFIWMEVDGEPDAKNILDSIYLEGPDDTTDAKNFKQLRAKAFCDLFEIPYEGTGFDLDAFPGARATCILEQKEWGGNVTNQIKLKVNA